MPYRFVRSKYSLRCILTTLVAVIVEVSDHRQIEDALTSLDVGDICHPLGIGLIRVKLSVKQVFILVDLLSYLPPLPRPADLRQHLIFLHDPQHSFGVAVDALTFQPQPHPPVTIALPDAGLLLLKKLPSFASGSGLPSLRGRLLEPV